MHSSGRDLTLGTAYSDHDLVVFLEGTGFVDPEAILDDRGEWSGAAVPPTSQRRLMSERPSGRAGGPARP
ncbi:hypothetical protein PV664_35300 [Streptomyces sp. ME01-18a]|uniref:hypothetical protein n=1 Tax=Streptomyces sp. ME01-18a TaxID=3028669 RepID=UPI0029B61F35|nr:hypothetical protein [Streptomyces sp. ME01-18a]MDX3434141.1 hypothetical protein [Streptomyces sp. ME01-18a]